MVEFFQTRRYQKCKVARHERRVPWQQVLWSDIYDKLPIFESIAPNTVIQYHVLMNA